ncbi:MAG: YkgJ family cysteine cluster protein [Halioglobus sp.]
MQCREACGACCIAPSIERGFYGMPNGKPAGVPCVHLDNLMRCELFEDPRRPALCSAFAAEPSTCGATRDQALGTLAMLELQTLPDAMTQNLITPNGFYQ